MKTNPLSLLSLRRFLCRRPQKQLCALLALAALSATPRVHAASQTWTNAPVSTAWTNVLNWVGKAVPGDINNTTANSVNGDIATFNSPLPLSGIGGAANPIVPDDATVVNGRSRRVAGITFDTTNCGAYVIASPSPAVITDGSSTLTTGYLYVSHTNFIRITDSVTNSQTVLIPMLVNLPSSTAGAFTLVNNSTNPSVRLIVASVTHAGATTRATTFILDGTNTANNVVTNLSEGSGNGTGGINKIGPGTWIVAGPGVFPRVSPTDSTINVWYGLLAAQDPAAFGTTLTTVINVVTNGTLRIDGVTLNQNVITLGNGGTVRMNGSATVNGITVPNVAGSSATLATTSASDVMTVGNAVNKVTGGASTSALHLTGPGTILLDMANNFAGIWSLDTGTNQLSDAGGLGAAANYILKPGAVLDLTPLGASAYAFTPKVLTANGTGTVAAAACMIKADPAGTVNMQSRAINLTFTPTSFNGDSGHAALYLTQGSFSFNGNSITVNNASGTALGVGTYQIVHQASGTVASSGAFVTTVTGAGLAAGTIGEIVASGSDLNLLVEAYIPKSLVWTGNDPLLPGVWDRQISTNWLSGTNPVTFNIYDLVTFDPTGAGQPVVTLPATIVPGSVTVDTSGGPYTFTGSGQIAGGAVLTKKGAGTLFLNTANTYSGGTLITNGTIKIGVDYALPSTGYGDVTNISPAVIDLNGFSDSVGALNGNGTVDVTGGGTSTLAFGANDNSGTFSGLIENSAGTLSVLKSGAGTQTLTASNSYSGPTIIDIGTLRVSNTLALGGGGSVVTITNGTLDVATNLMIGGLNAAGGFVVNASTSNTNLLTVTNGGNFGGVISGKLGVYVSGGTLRLNAANTYTNPTWVASGASLAFGNLGNVSSPVIGSNNATISMPTANNPSANVTANITTVDGATVTLTSGTTANSYSGQFNGSATATNIFSGGIMSISGAYSFSNFLGTVIITNGTARMNNAVCGGDNTVFNFINAGGMFTRDANVVRLGALFGNGRIDNPSVSYPGTYWIGAKNIDCEFAGSITGSNNIVKVGAFRLTLDGSITTQYTDGGNTYTNYVYSSALSYVNNTVVSNGVLAISVPNDLSYSPNITLAATNAILDTLNMGYVSNYTDINSVQASALITNGMLTIAAATPNGTPQALGGIGFVKCAGVTNNGTINPGFATSGGTLTVSNSVVVNASATNYFDLSDDLSGLVRASDLLKVQANVVLSGSSVIGVGALNGNIKAGKYQLIKYGGNLINESGIVPSGPVSNLSLGGVVPATTRATLVLSNAPGELDLLAVSLNTTNLTWAGDGVSNLWDVVTSPNWTNSLGAALQFFQMDYVTFDNTSTNPNVILQGAVAPSSITVNSSSNYLFGGTGSIMGGCSLTKTSTGSLTLTNGANSYYGGTIVNNGLLSVGMDSGGNQNDLALGTGTVTVNAGGELRFGGNGGTVVNHFITNAIVVNGGTVKAQDGVQHLTNSTVTISAGGGILATVFATKNLSLESPLLGNGNASIAAVPAGTNVAGGQVLLINSNNTFNGTLAILTNANLALSGYAGLTNCTSIDVQLGGILDISARSNSNWTVTSVQTLKGNGTVRGKFITTAAGSTVAPGIAGAIGALTITNNGSVNYAVITFGGTVSMDINRGTVPNCDRIINNNGTNLFGGTLTLNNLGATPQAGDTFQLFTSFTNTGAFTAVNVPALPSGLGWSNSLTFNGRLTVVTVPIIPTNSPAITNFSLAGANVVISGTNGQAGATYYLLSTTNLTKPTNQWRTLATNVLGASNYTFIGTNAVLSGVGQQFYMLSSTNYNP